MRDNKPPVYLDEDSHYVGSEKCQNNKNFKILTGNFPKRVTVTLLEICLHFNRDASWGSSLEWFYF